MNESAHLLGCAHAYRQGWCLQALEMMQRSPFRPPLAKVRHQVGLALKQALGRNAGAPLIRSSGDPASDRMIIVETVKSLDNVHTSTYRYILLSRSLGLVFTTSNHIQSMPTGCS